MSHPSQGVSDTDVIEMINSRVTQISNTTGKPVLIFTYSVVEEDEVHELPKKIAGPAEYGSWKKIESGEGIVDALSSYYQHFAVGVGVGENKKFIAWAPPNTFTTSGLVGTTTSAPVFDKTKNPPLFLGVVGMALTLELLNDALGTNDITPAIEKLA